MKEFIIKLKAVLVEDRMIVTGEVSINGAFSPAELMEHSKQVALSVVNAVVEAAEEGKTTSLN